MHVLIRPAEPADTRVLREIFRRSSLFNEGDRAQLLANPDTLELSAHAVSGGRTRVAATVDGQVVGFASTSVIGDALELDDLFVDPDAMGRGVGRKLVLDVQALARAQGFGRVNVIANTAALGFYERLGFAIDGEVATRFGVAPRMHLDVPC